MKNQSRWTNISKKLQGRNIYSIKNRIHVLCTKFRIPKNKKAIFNSFTEIAEEMESKNEIENQIFSCMWIFFFLWINLKFILKVEDSSPSENKVLQWQFFQKQMVFSDIFAQKNELTNRVFNERNSCDGISHVSKDPLDKYFAFWSIFFLK